MSNLLLKIKSQYTLKRIFAYVDYNRLLGLVKNNKKLQNRLEINLDNYKDRISYQYYKDEYDYSIKPYGNPNFEKVAKYISAFLFTLILFIYTLIYSSVLASKGAFNEKNLKDNYNKKYLNIVDKINLSLFGFLAYIIVAFVLIFVWATNDCYKDHPKTALFKKIVLILLAVIYLAYDILIIIKLHFCYKIKKNKTTWFMVCDYPLIILIFIYILYLSLIIYFYFNSGGRYAGKRIKYILTKFRGLEIKNFTLPQNFKKMKEYEKKKYILDNKNEYKIILNEKKKDLINLINNIRKKNNINELIANETLSFQNYIIDNYSEHIIYKDENNFKLSKEYYLFKYPLNKFKIKINDMDKKVMDVILNDYFNNIFIITKENNEYIFLFYNERKYLKTDIKCKIKSKEYLLYE